MHITARNVCYGTVISLACFAAIQLIPYGRDRINPPVSREPAWDSPATRALAKRACFNCHSNETEWPWYARVAPASWLIYHDVQEGRTVVNFSAWQGPAREGETGKKFQHEIGEGDMPPIQYRLAHPEARLTPAEKQKLIDGLSATAALPR